MSINKMNSSFNIQDIICEDFNKEEVIKGLDQKLNESVSKLKNIKQRYIEAVETLNALNTDKELRVFATDLREQYKKAVDDLKLEFEDEKSTLEYYKKTKNMLLEAEVKLSPDMMYDPKGISLRDMAKKASDEEKALLKKQELEAKLSEIDIESYQDQLEENGFSEDLLDSLFSEFVPDSGKADSVGGEQLRAIMRIVYRDYNDGDKFYEGYGLETCGSSAQYLMDNGYYEPLSDLIDQAGHPNIDDIYTEGIMNVAEQVVRDILSNPTLLVEENTEDSRNYNYKALKDREPLYSYEIEIPNEVDYYIEEGHIDIDDVVYTLEDWVSSILGGRVTINSSYYGYVLSLDDLTIDQYETIESEFSDGTIWDSYIQELADEYDTDEDEYSEDEEEEEIDEDLQIIKDTLNEIKL